MKVNGSFILGAALFVVAQAVPAGEGEKKPERWIEVGDIGQEIIKLKKEIELTPEQASKVFREQFPRLKAEWRQQLPAQIEPAPGARELPLPKNALLEAKDSTPYATALRFSQTQVVIVVLKPMGSESWHHYDDCLACLRVPRSADVDAVFGIKELEKTYGAVHKGLAQGSTVDAVVKVLGKPDVADTTQAVGYFHHFYFKDDIEITFLNSRVQRIKTGVPGSVKKRGDKEK